MGRFRSDVADYVTRDTWSERNEIHATAIELLDCECLNLEARGTRARNGNWYWTIQCVDCGLLEGDRERSYLQWVKKDHPLVLQAPDYIEIDHDLRQKTKARLNFYKSVMREHQHRRNVQNLRKEWKDYETFLKSPDWKRLRRQALERDKHICQLRHRGCTRRATIVHHITYDRWREKHVQDVISVCRPCHIHEHPHMRRAHA